MYTSRKYKFVAFVISIIGGSLLILGIIFYLGGHITVYTMLRDYWIEFKHKQLIQELLTKANELKA